MISAKISLTILLLFLIKGSNDLVDQTVSYLRIPTYYVVQTFIAGQDGNIYYPGFKRNFWLEFSSPNPQSATPPPATPPPPPRPVFLHPGTNGSVQTVTLGRTTKIDCVVSNLHGYQVSRAAQQEY